MLLQRDRQIDNKDITILPSSINGQMNKDWLIKINNETYFVYKRYKDDSFPVLLLDRTNGLADRYQWSQITYFVYKRYKDNSFPVLLFAVKVRLKVHGVEIYHGTQILRH